MAAAMSQQASPAASPPQAVTPVVGGPAPSGSTPKAKHPMDRTSIDVALSGTRAMSAEDLSAGFLNLQRLQVCDETFQSSVAGAAQYNADLLNLIVTQVNTLEAAAALATTNTMDCLQKVHDFTVERDVKVRSELDTAISALKVEFERLQALGRDAQSTPAPDLGRAHEKFEQLQQAVSVSAGRLAVSTEQFRT